MWAVAIALAAGWIAIRLQSGAAPRRAVAASAQTRAAPGALPFRFFAPDGIWNKPIAAGAPLSAHSRAMIERLGGEIDAEASAGYGPSINTTSYSVPIYTVAVNAATVPVTLESSSPARALRSAFSAVPLPATAEPAKGSDGHLVVWQPGTGRLWEFWRLTDSPGGWEAAWGGAMRDQATNPGVYGPQPGRERPVRGAPPPRRCPSPAV